MKNSIYFQTAEMQRLIFQDRLIYDYEQQLLEPLLSQQKELRVLDLGCNCGYKTANRFMGSQVVRVMGIEYYERFVEEAQQYYGNEKFTFHCCDIEADTFPEELRKWMTEDSIPEFDIIYLSFVMMHIKKPECLLRRLYPFLSSGGHIFIVDTDDRSSTLNPDPENLLDDFLGILACDPLAGDRNCAEKLLPVMKQCGYRNICMENSGIFAGPGQQEKKEAIFQVFFSYLPEDLTLLAEEERALPELEHGLCWVDQNWEKMKKLIYREDSAVSMGVAVVTCEK